MNSGQSNSRTPRSLLKQREHVQMKAYAKDDPFLSYFLLLDLYLSNTIFSKGESYVTTDFWVTLTAVLLTLFQNHFVKVYYKNKKERKEEGWHGSKRSVCVKDGGGEASS